MPFVLLDALSKTRSGAMDPPSAAGAAAWSDAAMICPWTTIYLRYGDTRLLEEQYAIMAGWVNFMRDRAGDDYIWRNDSQFGDWLDYRGHDARRPAPVTDTELVATACFAHTTHLLAQVARVLGRTSDAGSYADLAEEVRRVLSICWLSRLRRSPSRGRPWTGWRASVSFGRRVTPFCSRLALAPITFGLPGPQRLSVTPRYDGWSTPLHRTPEASGGSCPCLPAAPETIICYLAETADLSHAATLDWPLASSSYHHKQAPHALSTKDPEVERTMRGIGRAKGMAPNGKAPLLPAQLRQAMALRAEA